MLTPWATIVALHGRKLRIVGSTWSIVHSEQISVRGVWLVSCGRPPGSMAQSMGLTSRYAEPGKAASVGYGERLRNQRRAHTMRLHRGGSGVLPSMSRGGG